MTDVGSPPLSGGSVNEAGASAASVAGGAPVAASQPLPGAVVEFGPLHLLLLPAPPGRSPRPLAAWAAATLTGGTPVALPPVQGLLVALRGLQKYVHACVVGGGEGGVSDGSGGSGGSAGGGCGSGVQGVTHATPSRGTAATGGERGRGGVAAVASAAASSAAATMATAAAVAAAGGMASPGAAALAGGRTPLGGRKQRSAGPAVHVRVTLRVPLAEVSSLGGPATLAFFRHLVLAPAVPIAGGGGGGASALPRGQSEGGHASECIPSVADRGACGVAGCAECGPAAVARRRHRFALAAVVADVPSAAAGLEAIVGGHGGGRMTAAGRSTPSPVGGVFPLLSLPDDLLWAVLRRVRTAAELRVLAATCTRLAAAAATVSPGLMLSLYRHQRAALGRMVVAEGGCASRRREPHPHLETGVGAHLLLGGTEGGRGGVPLTVAVDTVSGAVYLEGVGIPAGNRSGTGDDRVAPAGAPVVADAADAAGATGVAAAAQAAVAAASLPPPPTCRPSCRGGIFADEPGLGKTVTAIALILKTRGVYASPPGGVSAVVALSPAEAAAAADADRAAAADAQAAAAAAVVWTGDRPAAVVHVADDPPWLSSHPPLAYELPPAGADATRFVPPGIGRPWGLGGGGMRQSGPPRRHYVGDLGRPRRWRRQPSLMWQQRRPRRQRQQRRRPRRQQRPRQKQQPRKQQPVQRKQQPPSRKAIRLLRRRRHRRWRRRHPSALVRTAADTNAVGVPPACPSPPRFS